MVYNVYLTAGLQVAADIICFTCCVIALLQNTKYKLFFTINAIAFFCLTIGDIYYNYMYRILSADIKESLGFVVTVSLLIFQLAQSYNWYSLAKSNRNKIISLYNMPYLSLTIILISIFIYYFLTSSSSSSYATWNQIISISIDMIVWFFAIICLANSRSIAISLLTLGCLIIISGDISSRCLFMIDPNEMANVHWIHIVRSSGAIFMAFGFIAYFKNRDFKFCPPNSIQESCCTWLSITSLTVFFIGFLFLSVFSLKGPIDFRSTLWNLPIAMVFTMLTAVLLGNSFSNIILFPVNYFLKKIEQFKLGNIVTTEDENITNVYEFKTLNGFINSSFNQISTQLDREIKLAAQVSHDIRSPLSALQILTEQGLPEIQENKRILIRDAVNQIRDITNNLEKNVFQNEKVVTQIAILLEHVLSERRTALIKHEIKITQDFDIKSYGLFAKTIPSEIRRAVTNIINNAAEAFNNKSGKIIVKLYQSNDKIVVHIEDNGPGIPENILPEVFERGFTTKSQGTGLGLFHAKESLNQISGDVTIDSTTNKGTIVKICIPIAETPNWFIDEINILRESSLICVDDSISVWNAWQQRFKNIKSDMNLEYCANKKELLQQLNQNNTKARTFFIDYEFSGEIYNGIDLAEIIISELGEHDRIFFLTSRSSEAELQNYCLEKNFHIIPKFFALKIPIEIVDDTTKL